MVFEINYTEGCQKCKLTDRIFKSKGLNSKLQLFTPDKLAYAKSKGMRVSPLVQVFDDNGVLIDEWNDFNVDKIKYWGK